MSRAAESDLIDRRRPDWEAIGAEVGVAVRTAELLGQGWSGWVYRVNHDLVFKLLKDPGEWREVEREIRFLDYARSWLTLPAADHLYQVRDSATAPPGYAVYRYLAGQGARAAVAGGFDRSALAAALARFLRALHAIDADDEGRSFLPREDEREVAEEYLDLAARHVASRVSERAWARLCCMFEDYLGDAANFPAEPRVIHADLSAAHVLCAGGAVTGILDWGDVCLGDPDYDFSYLYGDFGEAFVRELAKHYDHPDPDRLTRKARYYWIVDQIDTIACSEGRAPAADVQIAHQRLQDLLTS